MTEWNGEGETGSQAPVPSPNRLDLLDDLIADFEAKHCAVPDGLVEEAMRERPDYEGE